jgi:glycosyltransferase involved in cell wall biosynthesis
MQMNKPISISVAMATYNGADYISQQLESLASQMNYPLELVACDDGSTDETVSILEDFSAKAPFPIRIYRNERNLGFADNFLKAASLCRGDFISFCDQDDVWLPNKLKDAYDAIENNPEVQLVLQTAYICNERLDRSNRIFPNAIPPGLYGKQSQFGFWVWLGFLQTVRANMLEATALIDRPRNYYPGHKLMSHDKLTCLLANAFGGIVVLPESAALYRRHSNALTGDYAVQTMRQRLDKALPVGSDHYSFLAGVASETADYLRRLAEDYDPVKASSLRTSAMSFDKLSSIHAARADLYSSRKVIERLGEYAYISRSGGYVGPPVIALGWKSAAKDLLRVFGLLGKSQSEQSS